MDKIAFALIVMLLFASPASADPVERWHPYIAQAALRFGLPESWIIAVMRAESAGQVTRKGQPIRSRVGAIGLMQLMPATWQDMRAMLSLGSNPDDPHDNIMAGAAYLGLMFDRFGAPGCFAAYNSGPATYAAYLKARRRLPRETVAYVARITGAPVTQTATATPDAVRGIGSAVTAKSRTQSLTNPRSAGLFYVVGNGDTPNDKTSAITAHASGTGLFVVRISDPVQRR